MDKVVEENERIEENNGQGSIDNTNNCIKGISKSEHSIQTYVSNALRLTSISFGPYPENNKTTNQNVSEGVTLTELNKFITSCYEAKGTNEPPKPTPEAVHNVLDNTASRTNSNTQLNKTTSPPKLEKVHKKKMSDSMSEKSDLGIGRKDSMSSIGSNVCRICMTKGRERLISPCNCKGSLANVHLTCLERWLNQVGRNHCELCGYSYPAIRTPRYTVLQALRLWFGNPRNRGHLQSDCLIFWLLSTVTAGLLAVCVVGTQYFVFEGANYTKHGTRKSEGISHRITETAMDFFMAIVLCGYSVTVYLLWKDHFVMWNRWRRANVNVRLLLTPDSNPVPFVPRPRYSIV
ncbi:E3 ubiquitin-protein ligase MARCHF8-like isoform X2 [Aricia agestis]|uniref:E3 ubiquitin-protein ligase MARCHF8-like isoform X2 n=1 Tax=Aricia agestis TaxID=91739 RepID=UPI001C208E8A|nr:E3 ubiquitin-protein ligase MARCHF8-like isoform X2 [Aricia agestis]